MRCHCCSILEETTEEGLASVDTGTGVVFVCAPCARRIASAWARKKRDETIGPTDVS